jgi:hypothetical protein
MDYWAAQSGENNEHKCFVRVEFIHGGNYATSFLKYVDSALTIKAIKEKICLEKTTVKNLPINLRLHVEGFAETRMVGAAIFRVQNGDGSRTKDAEKYEEADENTLKQCLSQDGSIGSGLLDCGKHLRVILHWTAIR